MVRESIQSIFISRLRLALDKRPDLSQRKIAASFGIKPQTVNSWFTGKAFPRLEMVDQLADMLGVESTWLFGADSTATPQDALAVISKALGSQLKPKREIEQRVMEEISELSDSQLEKILKAIQAVRAGADSAPKKSHG